MSVIETPEVFTSDVQLISVNGSDWLAALGRCASCKTYALYIAHMTDTEIPDFQKVSGDYNQVCFRLIRAPRGPTRLLRNILSALPLLMLRFRWPGEKF